jgi:site-specific recombinase XerD
LYETASDISRVDEEFGFENENIISKRGPVKICEKDDKIRIINLQNACYHSLQELFTEHT